MAQIEVKQFHKRFNEGRYSAIYKTSTKEFKAAGSFEDVAYLLGSTRDRYGKVVRSKMTSFRSKENPDVTLIVAEFETTYERMEGWERFEFRLVKDKLLLNAYAVGPKAPTGESDKSKTKPE
ncbi:MAG TPA: hypothetical protein VMM38_13415 [Aridibacter sp.]|nr:hypothetical protein [Aridibacter sp.]